MKLKEKVEFILSTVPESRNSDITLTIELWKHYHKSTLRISPDGEYMIFVRSLWDLHREDHVKRYRAQIQNVELRYLQTDISILVERAKLSADWQRRLGYSKIFKDEWTDARWLEKIKELLEEKRQISLF